MQTELRSPAARLLLCGPAPGGWGPLLHPLPPSSVSRWSQGFIVANILSNGSQGHGVRQPEFWNLLHELLAH